MTRLLMFMPTALQGLVLSYFLDRIGANPQTYDLEFIVLLLRYRHWHPSIIFVGKADYQTVEHQINQEKTL
jgi:hypothetical protein